MLTTHDIGNLFQSMRTAYGGLWKHGSEAMDVWRNAMKHYSPRDLQLATNKAVKAYVEFPPNLPQFLAIIRESIPTLPGPAQDNIVLADRVSSYTAPESKINPKGNPHQIKLPESIATRQPGESARQYEIRIANEVTLSMYPHLRSRQTSAA